MLPTPLYVCAALIELVSYKNNDMKLGVGSVKRDMERVGGGEIRKI